jgi:hypothetical protein
MSINANATKPNSKMHLSSVCEQGVVREAFRNILVAREQGGFLERFVGYSYWRHKRSIPSS